MKKIITINRQFSTGGREIGKRLADTLQISYYDNELITKVAEESKLDPKYIARYEESSVSRLFPFTFGKTMTTKYPIPQDTVYLEQSKIIRKLAQTQDMVIVGRCASHILKDSAFKVFIYSSDMKKRIERCYDKVPSDSNKTTEEMQKHILNIDKERRRYYEFYTDEAWLDMQNHNLCIDTAKVSIEHAVTMIASLFK